MPFYFKRRYTLQKEVKYYNPETNEEGKTFVTRHIWSFIGVVCPFLEDYMIMETDKPKESIFHTRKEIDRVKVLFHMHNINNYQLFDADTKALVESNIIND